MRKRKSGSVIVTSSAAGSVTMPAMAWYPATKHALVALAGGLRMEMKNFGINVSIVELGYVDIPFSQPALKTLEKVEQNPLDPEYARQMAALRAGFGKAVNEDGAKVSDITKLESMRQSPSGITQRLRRSWQSS